MMISPYFHQRWSSEKYTAVGSHRGSLFSRCAQTRPNTAAKAAPWQIKCKRNYRQLLAAAHVNTFINE
jgi:hypothetical protein